MSSVNKQILIGRLGRDAELKSTQTGVSVSSFSLATSKKYKDQDQTQWHTCILFGKLAESLSPYLLKGNLVYAEGETRHRKYVNKTGSEVSVTEVIVDQIELLGSKARAEQAPEALPSDDIPF